jgi:hypothetical protein
MVSGTARFYRAGESGPARPNVHFDGMDPIKLAMAIFFLWLARRQALKAYRAAQSVVRPFGAGRPIGPERERIP